MTVYEMAQKYYPVLWDLHKLQLLLEAHRLTQEQYDTLVGENND